jgi:hypothetical protein
VIAGLDPASHHEIKMILAAGDAAAPLHSRRTASGIW